MMTTKDFLNIVIEGLLKACNPMQATVINTIKNDLKELNLYKKWYSEEEIFKLVNKYFVCGHEQGLNGAVHSKHCRKCKFIKELVGEKE